MEIKVPTVQDYQNYTGLHSHKLWAKVGESWICPSCKRSKYQMLHWAKRFPRTQKSFMDWVAILHQHHDHSIDSERSNARFPDTIICDQCNMADGRAKRFLKLPKDFSFSPVEISQFITANPHGAHVLNYERARVIYESLNQAR